MGLCPWGQQVGRRGQERQVEGVRGNKGSGGGGTSEWSAQGSAERERDCRWLWCSLSAYFLLTFATSMWLCNAVV